MKLIGDPPRPSGEWDVPPQQVAADVKQRAALKLWHASEDPERMAWLAAHGQPAPVGERLEYRHWLHDEDPDSTVPAFRVSLVHPKRQGGVS